MPTIPFLKASAVQENFFFFHLFPLVRLEDYWRFDFPVEKIDEVDLSKEWMVLYLLCIFFEAKALLWLDLKESTQKRFSLVRDIIGKRNLFCH